MTPEPLKKNVYTYWILLAGVILVEYLLIYPLWKRQETARRTLGIATVMGGAYPLAEAGALDKRTWWVIFCGFGIAGAVRSGADLLKSSLTAQQIRKELGDDAPHWATWERRIRDA